MPGGGAVHAPVPWLAEYVDLPDGLRGRRARRRAGAGRPGGRARRSRRRRVAGPIVVGRVLAFADEPQKNGKTIRWCARSTSVAQHRRRAARHRLRRAELRRRRPGRGRAARRRAAGRLRDRRPQDLRPRLGRDDLLRARARASARTHAGILVLPAGSAQPGADALDVLGLREPVLDIAVTTDRGYCLSMRGLAREAAAALDVGVPRRRRDVAAARSPTAAATTVRVDDAAGCDSSRCARSPGSTRPAPTPDVDAAAAAAVPGMRLDLARRGRHELRDARDRAAAARLRPGAS